MLAWLAALAITMSVPVPLRAADSFEIDAVVPLTGLLAFAGQTGAETIREVEKVVNSTGGIRGRPVHFVIRDDQSNPTVSVQIMNDVVARKASVILGGMLTANCAAMAPLAANRIVHYCISPGIHPAAGSYSFTAGPASTGYALIFTRYMRSRGWNSVAVISSTDASGQDLDDSFLAAMKLPENASLNLVAHERFNTADFSVSAQIARVKASGAQAVVVYSSGTAFGTVLRNAHDAGLGLPVFTTSGNQTMAALKQYVDVIPDQLYFPCFPVLANRYRNRQERDVQARFLNAQKAAGIIPDSASVSAWDPAIILVDAFRALGTDATAEQIHAWIENLHDYYGAFGRYDFRDGSQRGIVSEENLVVGRWDPAIKYWVGVSDFGGRPLPRR